MWVSAKFPDAIPRNDGVYSAGIIFKPVGLFVVMSSGCWVGAAGVAQCCVYAISPAEDKRLLCAATKLIAI